jgi:ubiquinol-cytochrome c reductase cytochrome c subunit
MRSLIFFGLAAALLALPSALAAQTPSATNGKKLFDSYGCYQCHDHDGHGGAGARLAPNPIPFAAFSKYVRQPAGEMPPYTKKVVSDAELADIYAYLQSVPPAPAAKNISILNH